MTVAGVTPDSQSDSHKAVLVLITTPLTPLAMDVNVDVVTILLAPDPNAM